MDKYTTIRTNQYELMFNKDDANRARVAAMWLILVAKDKEQEIFQEQQNLGWPLNVVRAAARMVSVA